MPAIVEAHQHAIGFSDQLVRGGVHRPGRGPRPFDGGAVGLLSLIERGPGGLGLGAHRLGTHGQAGQVLEQVGGLGKRRGAPQPDQPGAQRAAQALVRREAQRAVGRAPAVAAGRAVRPRARPADRAADRDHLAGTPAVRGRGRAALRTAGPVALEPGIQTALGSRDHPGDQRRGHGAQLGLDLALEIRQRGIAVGARPSRQAVGTGGERCDNRLGKVLRVHATFLAAGASHCPGRLGMRIRVRSLAHPLRSHHPLFNNFWLHPRRPNRLTAPGRDLACSYFRATTPSTGAASMTVIDSDAHIVECDETWGYLDPADRQYRPVRVAETDANGEPKEYWLIDGGIFPAGRPGPDAGASWPPHR